MRAPSVLAIVVHWRNVADTSDCLRSLAVSAYPNLATLLVDNGSADCDALAALAERLGARLVRSERNRGFAGGANLGLRVALAESPDYALLVNNDALVAPEAPSRLVATAESDAAIAAVGPKVLYAREPSRIWYLGGRWRGWFAAGLAEGADDDGRWDGVWPVDFVSGCGLLLRCSALRQVGLFDERFFTYYEDADLCRRLTAAGYRVVADGRARMWHRVAQSTSHDLALGRFLRQRSRVLFQLEAVGPRRRWAMALLLALASARLAARDLRARRPALAWAAVRGLWAGWQDAHLRRHAASRQLVPGEGQASR